MTFVSEGVMQHYINPIITWINAHAGIVPFAVGALVVVLSLVTIVGTWMTRRKA